MKKLLMLVLAVMPLLLNAQTKQPAIKPFSADEVKEQKGIAEAAYKALNFSDALKIYERLVVTDPRNADYNYKLGLCYMITNINKAKAVPFLEYAANANDKDKPKDVTFDLGRAYFYAGLYDKALDTYEKYRVEKHNSIDSKLKFDTWVDWAVSAKKITATPIDVTFKNMGKGINSNGVDYRPLMGIADTIIFFNSKRKGNTGGLVDELGEIPSDVYYWLQNDSTLSKAKNGGININTAFYEDALYVSPNGDRMLLYMEGPESNGDLHIAKQAGKNWDKPVVLGKDFTTKALETGATMSPDGLTLYFSAEVGGSKTGKDIYVCTRTESTSWSKPERLGDNINTKGDEDAPVMWIDGKTLFFSSTGHGSMGGYDLFKVTMKDPREGFNKPENLGCPINTLYDDIGIALKADGKSGYLSQVRDSGMGDFDIYAFDLQKPLVDQTLTWIEGRTYSLVGTAAKGAFVTITDAATGTSYATIETNDATGRFDVALPPGTYKVVAKHAKLGKCEADIAVGAGEYKQVLDMKFPN